jgi:membrane-associated protease RseP (regulator of RpoE activity)
MASPDVSAGNVGAPAGVDLDVATTQSAVEVTDPDVVALPARPATSTDAGGPPVGTPAGPPPAISPRWALIRLAVALVVVVGLFMALHATALLIVIVAIVIMVMIHELGHLVTAKRSGMLATQYFLGFGPTLWSVRRGETEYGVKAIPAGGFVKIPGMTNLEEVDLALEARTYRRQPFASRIIVASAGSFMHFVMAFALAWVAVVAFGVPSSTGVGVHGFTTWPGHAQTAAQAAGIEPGDIIVSVNGKAITDETQLSKAIKDAAGTPVPVTVDRGTKTIDLTVTPALGHVTSAGLAIGPGKDESGVLGIETQAPFTAEGPFRALGTAGVDVGRVTAATVTGIGRVFSPHGLDSLATQVLNPQAAAKAAAHPQSSDRVSSIVGATNIAVQAEEAGVLYLLEVLIALNIVLGLLNMLPMLPLDGGHVAIAIYERIRTRKGQPYYQADAAKLMPVVYAFVTFLAVVVLAAVFLDIAHPAANVFH